MAKTPALRECERDLMPEDQFLLASVSAQTRRCYAGDWRRFEHWCASVGHKAMPASPQTVVAYLVGMARILGPDGNPAYKAPTINRHAAAIAWVHHRGGLPSPTTDPLVRKALSGIKRTLGVRPARPRPLVLADVSAILAAMRPNLWPEGVLAARDALAILLGFVGALRRSEVASLRIGDVRLVPSDGLHVFLGPTKTDQEGAGQVIGLPFGTNPLTCPVCAWSRWMDLLVASAKGRFAMMRCVLGASWDQHVDHNPRSWGLAAEAPLLRAVRRDGTLVPSKDKANGVSGESLSVALTRRAAQVGIESVSFHSLRAGFVTQARRNGADARSIRLQTRHASDRMIDLYDREYLPLEHSAVRVLGI